MKVQFDHEFQSSFYLFLDNHILYKGQGSGNSEGMYFNYYNDTSDVYQGLSAFYSPQKQLVADGIPSGDNKVYIKDGAVDDGWYGQTTNGTDLLILDHYDGRVILNSGYYGNPDENPGMTVSGNFAQKDFNVYITNESEEQLLMENEFIIASDNETYYESVSGLNKQRYVIPAAFISLNNTVNTPYGFGGEDDTKENIRLVCIGDSNYGLDGILSLCRDAARKSFPVISYSDFPYGEFFHIKDTGYAYTGIQNQYSTGKHAYIEEATTSKLFDRSNNRIPKQLRVGFVDFQVANIRYPRS
tara:strand:- start:3360 stop:4259 length:900 start_codon:yes stop_codon:yes gene_type:complete